MAEALQLPVSTKLHRTIHHVTDHLYMYGCARRGDTDQNETLHKLTKSCYLATNKQLPTLAAQVLKICTPASAPCIDRALREAPNTSRNGNQRVTVPLCATRNTLRTTLADVPLENVEAAIESLKKPGGRVWKRVKSIRIQEIRPSYPDRALLRAIKKQVAYATDDYRGAGQSFDAIAYVDGDSERFGFIQSIFLSTLNQQQLKFAIVRVLEQCEPHVHNTRFVTTFGHKRLRYKLRSDHAGDCCFDIVLQQDILRVEPIVRDTHEAVLNYSLTCDIASLPDTREDRQRARFFKLEGVCYTSLPNILD